MSRRQPAEAALLPASPLLITETAHDFERIRDSLNEEIMPRGIVERMYVADIAFLTWEILRFRRCRAALINLKFHDALKKLLRGLSDIGSETYVAANDLSHDWFTDPDARKEVLQILEQFHLDESAIEAEAIRESAEDLELLDRLLASLETRRNKALRCIAEYRGSLAKDLCASSSRIIDGKVLTIEEPSRKNHR
jgi:hypothetical protein